MRRRRSPCGDRRRLARRPRAVSLDRAPPHAGDLDRGRPVPAFGDSTRRLFGGERYVARGRSLRAVRSGVACSGRCRWPPPDGLDGPSSTGTSAIPRERRAARALWGAHSASIASRQPVRPPSRRRGGAPDRRSGRLVAAVSGECVKSSSDHALVSEGRRSHQGARRKRTRRSGRGCRFDRGRCGTARQGPIVAAAGRCQNLHPAGARGSAK